MADALILNQIDSEVKIRVAKKKLTIWLVCSYGRSGIADRLSRIEIVYLGLATRSHPQKFDYFLFYLDAKKHNTQVAKPVMLIVRKFRQYRYEHVKKSQCLLLVEVALANRTKKLPSAKNYNFPRCRWRTR